MLPKAPGVSCRNAKQATPSTHLLDLPVEVTKEIIKWLPSEALQACLDVHPRLADIIKDSSFLNYHTRKELNLKDNDVRFDVVPESLSPLLELWFITNAASTARRRPRKFGPVLNRNDLFFPLACFKHSFQTWLAQAGGSDLGGLNRNGNIVNRNNSNTAENDCISTNFCNSNNWPVSTMPLEAGVGIGTMAEACHWLLTERPRGLPKYVKRVLTKLSLAVPDFLEGTLYTQHLTLHRGAPVTLANTWEVFIQPQLRARNPPSSFKPLCSLEIIFSRTNRTDSSLCLNHAMAILFARDTWILWIGTLAPFPVCKHDSTLAFKTLDVACSVASLKNEVSELTCMLNTASGAESLSHRWMLQKLFPGVCHMIHDQDRQTKVDKIESNIKLIVRHIQLIILNRTLKQSEVYLHPNLGSVLRKIGINSFSPLSEEDSTSATFTGSCPLQQNEIISLSQPYGAYLVEHIRSCLQAKFSEEAKFFFCNRQSHMIVCQSCSQLWFPKRATLEACIAQFQEQTLLPFNIWPYHLLDKTIEMVDEALMVCASSSC
ncbi:hypothetical protein EGW08_000938 [Elysia chlorotica]|uniref:F-box domain-containing protein n=1 Tax=Elysia chlorotica TaxID=188477 RepID=A0A433UC43_ELYCH|nr:hypothetical protein EGW08_000938 [Elysia chlorotica]